MTRIPIAYPIMIGNLEITNFFSYLFLDNSHHPWLHPSPQNTHICKVNGYLQVNVNLHVMCMLFSMLPKIIDLKVETSLIFWIIIQLEP